MKLYKNILITFVTAIITVMFVYGGYTIYAVQGEEGYEEYYKFTESLFFWSANEAYNFGMNQFFNDRFKALTELIQNDSNFFNNPKYKAPVIVKTDPAEKNAEIREKCKGHLGSFCVAMDALDIYLIYVEFANSKKGELPSFDSNSTAQEIIGEIEYKSEYMERAVKDARKVMEASIAAYNEFQMAYPMHKQYEKIIKSLNKYRKALKKVKREAFLFPKRFVDATSDQCE